MLNFINKILNYFWYVAMTTLDRDRYETEIEYKIKLLEEEKIEKHSLKREKDKLINLVADKDKDILTLEHKVENFQWVIEQDKLMIEDISKLTIELADKIAKLESNVLDCLKQIDGYKQLANQRYKEVNVLRSRVKWLTDSRDNYKRKYREVCWKIALKKYH